MMWWPGVLSSGSVGNKAVPARVCPTLDRFEVEWRMMVRVRSKTLQGLVAGTLALLSYLPDADATAADGDEPFLEALVDDAESGDVDVFDRPSVLRRLSVNPSAEVRARVAEAAGALALEDPTDGLALLRELSHDGVTRVRRATARGLAHFMDHASGPLRAAVESDWTTTRSATERATLARALGAAKPDWMTDLALAELATDARPGVRRAAVDAARQKLESNPSAYVQLAAERTGDPDRHVRKSARQLLRQAEPAGWTSGLRPPAQVLRESRKRFRQAMRLGAHPQRLG